jgi:hypothetical protein
MLEHVILDVFLALTPTLCDVLTSPSCAAERPSMSSGLRNLVAGP